MTDELVLGITVFNGARTIIPSKALELLKLRYTPQKQQKLLWTHEGDDVLVKKATLQSSFRKTMLTRGGKTAVPKHIREYLKVKSTPEEERLVWIQRGDEVIVRMGST